MSALVTAVGIFSSSVTAGAFVRTLISGLCALGTKWKLYNESSFELSFAYSARTASCALARSSGVEWPKI